MRLNGSNAHHRKNKSSSTLEDGDCNTELAARSKFDSSDKLKRSEISEYYKSNFNVHRKTNEVQVTTGQSGVSERSQQLQHVTNVK